MKVLAAEDDPVSRLILRKAVERAGHDCLVAGDGLEAWELFQREEPDVVISDWMMPGLDGPELCARVRALGRESYTYFILLTALDDREYFLTGLRGGADDYLTKPLDRDALAARLLAAERVTSLHRELVEKSRELERLNRVLAETARTDPLTGLGNRLRLQEDLGQVAAQVERYGRVYGAALLDVDHFKAFNDRFGHLEGDRVLRQVADAIKRGCRASDTAYRYGGEEFLLLLPEQTPESAAWASERLRRLVETLAIPHPGNPVAGRVTVSVGVALLAAGSEDAVGHWLSQADQALYQAKASGRNRVVVYHQLDQAGAA